MTPVEFREDLWHQKTRVPGLSRGVVCGILHLAILMELPTCDRQTDRQTDRHRETQTDRRRPMASTADELYILAVLTAGYQLVP